MAIKPLKTIKFPELPDTYTIPQVDPVPTQGSSNAVSSGGVYAELTGLKEDCESKIGNPDYTPLFELGHIYINTTRWTYSDSNVRVRTKKGTTIHLKAGVTIGLTDYADARYYVGWLTDGTYETTGEWKRSDYTTTVEGDYVILIGTYSNTEQSSSDALASLFFRSDDNLYGRTDDLANEIDSVNSALDGIQAEIPTVDSVPTQGSSNAVSSGGVWDRFAQVENDLNTKAITPITVDNTNFATRLSDDMIVTTFNELPNYRKIEGMSIANGKLGTSTAFNCILFTSPYDGFAFEIGSAVGDIYVLNNFPEGNAGETLDIKDTIVGTATDVTGNLRFTIPDKYSIVIFKFNASYVERMRTAISAKFKMENLELMPMQDSFIRYAHTKESTNILPFTLNKEDGKLINASNGGLSTNASYDTYWFKVPVSEITVTCTNGFRAALTSLPPTDITANGYLDRVIYTYASGRVETFTAKYGQYVGISVGSSADISLKTDLIKTFTLPTLQLDYGQKGRFYRFAKSGSATYLYVYFSSGEKIVGYQLHNVPASGSNSNTWQLGHIMGYDFDGVNVSNGVELVGGGEFELAFKEFGSSDYCGGNNHGDENTIDFVLLIDGKQIDLTNVDTNIHAFDRIDAVEHAYVNRCDTPDDNILKHQKIWTFENGKVKVKQTLEFLQGLNCDFLCCMFAANRTSFTAGVRQGGVDAEIMTDSSFAKKSTSGNEMMYLMYGADVSAKITAKTCAHTPEASLWINPATSLNKLYYNFYGQKPNTAVEEGTVIWWEQEYEVAYT